MKQRRRLTMQEIRHICRVASQKTHARARQQGYAPTVASALARREMKQLYVLLIKRYRAAQVHRARTELDRATVKRDARWSRAS